jgi:hypothetical protein
VSTLACLAVAMTSTLAQAAPPASGAGYRPFLDPLQIHDQWWLTLIPLALLISVAYKAVRVRTFQAFPRAVLTMTVQIVVAMIALGVVQHLFVEIIVPALAG